jgi:putative membrane protein
MLPARAGKSVGNPFLMANIPYTLFPMPTLPPLPAPHLTLRDELALERTNLANERTWLAYLRTGMALVIAGLSLINFFREYVFVWIGAFFIPFGLALVALGWVRFRTKYRRINAALRARQVREAAYASLAPV